MRHSGYPIKAVLALCEVVAMAAAFQPAHADIDAGKSVVKITCKTETGGERVGTGFAWNSPDQVVTALHVVAGCKVINIYSEGQKTPGTATRQHAYVSADLALLKLDKQEKPIVLVPLAASDEVVPTALHVIWGYPKSVRKMQGDDLHFSRVLSPASVLSDVLTEKQYEAALGNVGYPALDAPILRVGSTIQPGHSGAPIVDGKGKVVGVGDGGLYEGIKSINWAIPARLLPVLAKTQDKVPDTEPNAGVQFSAAGDEEPSQPVQKPQEGKWYLKFSASIENILATVSPEEKQNLSEMLSEADEDLQEDSSGGDDGNGSGEEPSTGESPRKSAGLEREILDVYEEPATGATMALPQGFHLNADAKWGLAKAYAENKKLEILVQVANRGSAKSMQAFEAACTKGSAWKPDPDFEEVRHDADGLIEVERSLWAGTNPKKPEQLLYYSATREKEDDSFIGIAVAARELAKMEESDIRQFRLMAIAVGLSGFRVD